MFSARTLSAAALALACLLAFSLPARADRWFGSITASCDSFGLCGLFPAMPEPPGDSASLQIDRAGTANALLEIRVYVNRPVEGGTPIRLELGTQTFDLQPGTDVLTRRVTHEGKERTVGYWIAAPRVGEVLAAMRKTDSGHLKITITDFYGKTHDQDRLILLDGLDAALRYLDERQGRAGAQDALIDQGPRPAADTPAPQPLPPRTEWPKPIARIFAQEKCEDMLPTFGELAAGAIATLSGDREVWQIACAGGNYNIHFIFIAMRNGDPRTARALTFPTRRGSGRAGVLTNPVWWYARKELWAFERHHSQGDCGEVARYRWTGRDFALIDQRRKEDCDSHFTDPWTTWPVTKPKRGRRN